MDFAIKELTEALEGVKNHIRRLLEVKGFSSLTINEVMNHIERVIALSGNIGKVFEQNKYVKAVQVLNARIAENEREITKLRAELRKYEKSL